MVPKRHLADELQCSGAREWALARCGQCSARIIGGRWMNVGGRRVCGGGRDGREGVWCMCVGVCGRLGPK